MGVLQGFDLCSLSHNCLFCFGFDLHSHIYDMTLLLQMLATSHNQISVAAITTVADVLEKLLVVGITDTGG